LVPQATTSIHKNKIALIENQSNLAVNRIVLTPPDNADFALDIADFAAITRRAFRPSGNEDPCRERSSDRPCRPASRRELQQEERAELALACRRVADLSPPGSGPVSLVRPSNQLPLSPVGPRPRRRPRLIPCPALPCPSNTPWPCRAPASVFPPRRANALRGLLARACRMSPTR